MQVLFYAEYMLCYVMLCFSASLKKSQVLIFAGTFQTSTGKLEM